MKSLCALAALFVTMVWLTAVAAAPGGVPASVHYIPQAKVAAVMAKGGAIIEDPGLRVLAQHRGAGEAELHEHTNHIFIMTSGEATFVTGGKLVNAKRSAPDQMRAPSIEGGQSHHLTKGDVITIPKNTPHWWKEVPSKNVEYYGVNIEN